MKFLDLSEIGLTLQLRWNAGVWQYILAGVPPAGLDLAANGFTSVDHHWEARVEGGVKRFLASLGGTLRDVDLFDEGQASAVFWEGKIPSQSVLEELLATGGGPPDKEKEGVSRFGLTSEINRSNFIVEERIKDNLQAIRLMKQILAEGRGASDPEKSILVRYSGWGGSRLSRQVADSMWSRGARDFTLQSDSERSTQELLVELLTEDELNSVRDSSDTAFYTSPDLVNAMWRGMAALGFKGGQVLDPSSGVGNFQGLIPEAQGRATQFCMIEKDLVAGQIASLVYDRDRVFRSGFEEVALPRNYFDAVISNVPFGDYQVYDSEYAEDHLSVHNYFIVKSLDRLRPGGICAVITSSFTMDAASSRARRMMHERGHLIAAYRLPTMAHRVQASVDVTTDILYFRRRSRRPVSDDSPNWLDSVVIREGSYEGEAPIRANQYFLDNPDHVMGTMAADGYGRHARVKVVPDERYALSDLLDRIPADLERRDREQEDVSVSSVGLADPFAAPDLKKNQSLHAERGAHLMLGSLVRLGDLAGEIVGQMPTSATGEPGDWIVATTRRSGRLLQRVLGLIDIRDKLVELFVEMRSLGAEETPEYLRLRGELNDLYDDFVARFGYLNEASTRRLFASDPWAVRVFALEVQHRAEDDRVVYGKSDIFSRRTVAVREKPEISSVDDALLFVLSERGLVDVSEIASLMDSSEEAVVTALTDSGRIFYDPEKQEYDLAERYLSGNIYKKLVAARLANELSSGYERNIRALEDVRPPFVGRDDIQVRVGSTWLPVDYLKRFIVDVLQIGQSDSVYVEYFPMTSRWEIQATPGVKRSAENTAVHGTTRMSALSILSVMANQNAVKVYNKVRDEQGKERSVLDAAATQEAQFKVDEFNRLFSEFIWESDEGRASEIEDLYNRSLNVYVGPKYNGSHLVFPEMNADISLRSVQSDMVWRGLQECRGYIAHEVGLGKTYVQVAIALEARRLGLFQKSMVVVPNHMVFQFAREASQLYPTANIMAVSKKDFEKRNRQAFLSRIANNAPDLIVISHSQFGLVGASEEYQIRALQEELIQLESVAREASSIGRRRASGSDINKMMKRRKAKLQQLKDRLSRRQEDVLCFEDLGVDALFIDEAHNYKNLNVDVMATDLNPITGSQKAYDLYLKTRLIHEKHGKPIGIFLASGTPVSNNILELYNIQKYLTPDILSDLNMTNVNAWAGAFLTPKTQYEPSPSGTGFRLRTRYAMVNVPELMDSVRMVMDVKNTNDAGITIPELETVNVDIPLTDAEQRGMAELDSRVRRMQEERVDPAEDNHLKVISDGRKLSLDGRLYSPDMPDLTEDSKVYAVVEQAHQLYHEWADQRGSQIVFCDQGVPGGQSGVNVYEDIRERLQERGVPAKEIAFIHDYENEQSKQQLFSAVREGSVRILLGSTGKMGEGTNFQERVVAIHHMDAPWRPSDIRQRDGRGWRQGNLLDGLRRYIYTKNGSFDLFMWNTMKVKAETFSRILEGDRSVREFDTVVDPTFAETAAITSGNPLIRDKLELDQHISELETEARVVAKGKSSMLSELKWDQWNWGRYASSCEFYDVLPEVEKSGQGEVLWRFDASRYGEKLEDIATADFDGLRKSLTRLFRNDPEGRLREIRGLSYGGIPFHITIERSAGLQQRRLLWHIEVSGKSMNFDRGGELQGACLERVARHQNYRKMMADKEAEMDKKRAALAEMVFEGEKELEGLYERRSDLERLISGEENDSSEASCRAGQDEAPGGLSH